MPLIGLIFQLFRITNILTMTLRNQQKRLFLMYLNRLFKNDSNAVDKDI